MKTVYCKVRVKATPDPSWPMADVWFNLWDVVLYGRRSDPSYCEWIVPGTIVDIEV